MPRLTLITQNVDGLHRRAGCRTVVELHGDISRVRCSREGTPAAEWEEPPHGGEPPKCSACGAYLRPGVVWFGEMLPEDSLLRSRAAARECDLFLAVGTSNLVEPAASLPWIAASRGTVVAMVNTTMDGTRPRGERASLDLFLEAISFNPASW